MNDNSNFELLGNFSIHDAKSICDGLEEIGIQFEIETDDSAIKDRVSRFGTYGMGVTANVYVSPDNIGQCQNIMNELGVFDNRGTL